MNEYFWLLCGLWCGIGGSIFAWFQLKKDVKSGEFSQAEVLSFVKGMAFWIFVPCLILWILQFSVSGVTQPDYMSWPSPQKYIALALQIFIWVALAGWVFFKNGAGTLSRFSVGFFNAPEFLRTSTAFKFYAVAIIISGFYAVFILHA
jgi:hypothetical protein